MFDENITKEEQQEYLAYHNIDDFFENLENGIRSLDDIALHIYQKKYILLCGGMLGFDKGLSQFLNLWNEKQDNLFLLSEVTAQYRRYTKERIKFPHLCTPHLLAKEIILYEMPIPLTKEMTDLFDEKTYIQEAVLNMEEKYQRLGEGYATAWSYYAYQYILKLLKQLQPMRVILWNEFYAFHHIIKHLCMELGIPVSYIEFGCLPGTICIEEKGQQGESLPARLPYRYKGICSTKMEIDNATTVLDYLQKTKLNRNIQPNILLSKHLLTYYNAERKTLVYIGQNDYESGMYPYTRNTQKYHSPIFKTTLEALKHLSLLSINNEWNLIFKPHPNIVAVEKKKEWIHKVDIIENANINSIIDFADVVITILSQSAYIALIREKPVLMLGYSQLKKKGCTYEAFQKSQIKKQIICALRNGFTKKQRQHYKRHIAKLLKSYLYSDSIEKDLQIGRAMDKRY
jgi:Capsule polysaccharide export protein